MSSMSMPYQQAPRLLPLPSHWLLLGLVLAAVVILAGMTIRLDPGITSSELTMDELLSRNHLPVLTALALALNVIFGPVVGGLITITASLYLLLAQRSLQKAALFALTVASGWLTCQVFKLVIGRIRPDPAMLFDPLVPEPASNSFPSGHTALAVALALAVFFTLRGTKWAKPALWTGAVVAVVVGWSRVYIGAHYPLDVVASFPASIAAILIMAGMWNRHAPALFAKLHARPAYRHLHERRKP